jgi:hypothetical protein
MITRSGTDTQIASQEHAISELPRNERYHQPNGGAALMTRAVVVSIFLSALAATSGCSTQSPVSSANRHTDKLAGPGEFILTPEGRIVIIKKRDPKSSR